MRILVTSNVGECYHSASASASASPTKASSNTQASALNSKSADVSRARLKLINLRNLIQSIALMGKRFQLRGKSFHIQQTHINYLENHF